MHLVQPGEPIKTAPHPCSARPPCPWVTDDGMQGGHRGWDTVVGYRERCRGWDIGGMQGMHCRGCTAGDSMRGVQLGEWDAGCRMQGGMGYRRDAGHGFQGMGYRGYTGGGRHCGM